MPRLLEDYCAYVNEYQTPGEALHAAAYALWRLNWIHPFTDGNGRTSRALAYVVFCAASRQVLPGEPFPEGIARERVKYYHLLEEADGSWRRGKLRLRNIEGFLDRLVKNQLRDFRARSR